MKNYFPEHYFLEYNFFSQDYSAQNNSDQNNVLLEIAKVASLLKPIFKLSCGLFL